MNKKIKIASTMKNYSLDEALDDYKKLVEIHPNSNDLNKIIGNKFVDYFMFPYRLNVPCGLKKNITFSRLLVPRLHPMPLLLNQPVLQSS